MFDRALLLACIFLTWWYFPIISGVYSTFSGTYGLFQQFKYIIPIIVCLFVICSKQTNNKLEEYFPVGNIMRTMFADDNYQPMGHKWAPQTTPTTPKITLAYYANLLAANQGRRCRRCYQPLNGDFRVAYLVAPTNGGTYSLDNLQAVCPKCV